MHPDDKERIFNRWWRIEHLYWIQTKKAKAIRFTLKKAQRRLAKILQLWHKLLILKARQVGISTFFLIFHLDRTLFTPNTTTCILAHRRDSLHKLFRIIKFAYQSCPDRIRLADGRIWEKPKAKYDNAHELYFEGINSRIYVALEVRSDTLHGLHVSEAAFIKNAVDVLTATLGAVVDGGYVTVETTANGMGGLFYELWQQAIAFLSDYLGVFIGAQDDEDYSDEIEDEKAFKETLTEDEQVVLSKPGVTLGNISWRRRQLRDPAKKKKFKQEFPYTPEEAFLTTGRSPFDREKIMDWPIRPPIESKMEGRLLYWFKPVEGRRYIIGVDCASGAGEENLKTNDEPEGGTDYTSIGVWDCETLQKVCMFRAKWPYSKLHQIVYRIGKEYNWAYCAIEATDHGLTVINNLVEHVGIDDPMPYPREMIHTTTQVDHKSKKSTLKWGWYTNLKTKPLIIDHLAGLIDEEVVKVYSQAVQNEFLKFIINEKGQYEAMQGYKDDCVLQSAIALYLIPDALRAGRMTATKEELGLN